LYFLAKSLPIETFKANETIPIEMTSPYTVDIILKGGTRGVGMLLNKKNGTNF
jgi:hypothetical protein